MQQQDASSQDTKQPVSTQLAQVTGQSRMNLQKDSTLATRSRRRQGGGAQRRRWRLQRYLQEQIQSITNGWDVRQNQASSLASSTNSHRSLSTGFDQLLTDADKIKKLISQKETELKTLYAMLNALENKS